MALFNKLTEIKHFVDIVMFLLCELRKTLLEMWMEGSGVNKQLFTDNVLSKSVLRDHTFNSGVKDPFRLFLEYMLHLSRLQVSNISRVLSIHFLLSFTSGHVLVCSVNNYTEVTMFTCSPCYIVWLVLSSQEVSCKSRNATQGHPRRIKKVPGLTLVLHGTVHGLRLNIRLSVVQSTISKLGVNIIHTMSNVFIELNLSVLSFRLEGLSTLRHLLSHLAYFIDGIVRLLSCKGRKLHSFLRLHICFSRIYLGGVAA